MKKPILLSIIFTGLAAVAMAQTEPANPDAMFTVEAEKFVATATSANVFEIRSSELAAERSTRDDLKAYGAQMIADHTQADAGLKAAAGEIPMPEQPLPKHAGMVALLEKAEGAEFDMLYTEMQTISHLEAVGLFQTYADGGDNAELKAFAAATLPALEMHTTHIKEIAAMK